MTTEAGARETLEGGESFLRVLLRYRHRLFFAPLVIAFVISLALYLSPRDYTVSVTFLPSASGEGTPFAGLAAQVGIALPGGGTAVPRVFTEVLKSNQSIRAAVLHRYTVRQPRMFGEPTVVEGTLVDLYEIDEESLERGIQKAMARLRKNLSAEADDISRMATLRVTAKWPDLSYAVVQVLLEELNHHNQDARQSQGRAERMFVEERLQVAMASLTATEDSLQNFLAQNRQFRSSPSLTVEYERLQRSVGLRQQVVVTLTQALEQARIAEVRDTPVITIVSQPIQPAKGDRRNLVLKAAALYVALLGVAIVLAFGAEIVSLASGVRPPENELRTLIAATKEELAALRRRVPFLRAR